MVSKLPMWPSAKLLWLLFIISGGCDANIHSIHTHQPLSRNISGLSFNFTSNSSASPTATTERFKSSPLKSTTNTSIANFLDTNDNTTSLPAPFYFFDEWGKHLRNFQHIKAGFCDLDDSFCFFRNHDGTMTKAIPASLDDMCVLWDSSCSGNRTTAIEKFFRSTVDFGGNPCFEQTPGGDSSACVTYNPPARLLEWDKIKRWMRSSQCSSALDVYDELSKTSHGTSERFYPDVSTCCLRCYIQAENVDLYYWPEPDADTSCLGIIGGSVRPLDYGATKVSVSVLHQLTPRVDIVTYWGCTASTLKTDILAYKGHLTTWHSGEKITTAKISTIGSLTVKLSAFNPWSSAPCPQEDAASQISEVKVKPRAPDRSSMIPSSITQKIGSPVSVISDGFTFVSPSVYARFHRIQAYDGCEQTTIPPMMLSFSPGELSTIEGPISVPAQLKHSMVLNEKKPFNFGDLPCPPQSVMVDTSLAIGTYFADVDTQEANWYKPAPGEPYRPLIAMPNQLAEKLREIDPRLSSCKADFFTAFDPPRALMPISALIPAEPAGEPKPAPVPSPTDGFGARETIAGQGAAAKPPSVPTVDQPKETIDSAPILTNESPATQHYSDDPAKNSIPPPQEQHSPGDPSPATQHYSDDPAKNSISPPQEQHSPGDPNTDNNQGSSPNPGKAPNKDTDPAQNEVDVNSENEAGPNSNAHGDSKQVDAPGQVKEEPAQKSSLVNLIGTLPSLDPSDDPVLADGAPVPADPVTTINNQIVQPLSHGISVVGTTLTPGAPAITASGTSISLGSSAFIIGTSTVPLLFQPLDPFITTVAGHPITAAPSAVDVAGTTLHPGIPGATLDGTAVSLDTANHLIIGSKTIALSDGNRGLGRLILGGLNDQSSPGVAEPFITTIAGHAITAAPNAVDVAGTTLHPGDSGMTVDGTAVALDTAHHLVIGSKIIPLTDESTGLGGLIMGGLGHPSTSDDDIDVAEPLTTTIAGQAITAAPNAVEVAGSTLHPGDHGVTLDGTLVSLDRAQHLIVGSKTVALPTSEATGVGLPISGVLGGYYPPSDDDDDAHPSITTVAGQAITAAPTAVAFAGMTLTPGAPGKRINGTLVSLNTAGELVVGSKTVALQSERGGFGTGVLSFSSSSSSQGIFSSFSSSSSSSSSSYGTGNLTDTGGGIKVVKGNAAALLKRGLYSSLSLLLLSSFVVAFLPRY